MAVLIDPCGCAGSRRRARDECALINVTGAEEGAVTTVLWLIPVSVRAWWGPWGSRGSDCA